MLDISNLQGLLESNIINWADTQLTHITNTAHTDTDVTRNWEISQDSSV